MNKWGAWDSSESVDWIRPPPEAARSVPADNWAHSQREVLQQCSGEAYGDADYFLILAEIGGRGVHLLAFPCKCSHTLFLLFSRVVFYDGFGLSWFGGLILRKRWPLYGADIEVCVGIAFS